MFWRKKGKLPLLRFLQKEDRRGAFRFTPPEPLVLEITVDGEIFSVKNISAGGFAFVHPELSPGDEKTVTLVCRTPDLPLAVSLHIEVLAKAEGALCHCRFRDLDLATEEMLHQFVLAAQRRDLVRKRKERIALIRREKEQES